ncbi:MAG: nucleotidyltransferase domain-containing protein [Nanoarchaeota archaeon]|nr:nucleotidyltransferase domain-containing protein [Nanoarchaeota archaeon]MBU4451849.1 nucleotidyltransferase domain-containing protein [Nanoarchaeota archaeon]MCG2724415.1 nucleotidyltransferase domain-containing protein [archaeon]
MQFRNFAENLLGSKVKVKLLKYLISEGAITSEREISRIIGASSGAVNRTLKEFSDLNLIRSTRIGNVTAWQLNEKSYAYSYITNFFNKLKSREEPISELGRDISKALADTSGIKKAILFGSVAEGRELPESDIDLFILIENEKSRGGIQSAIGALNELCLQKYGNILSLYVLTPNEVKEQKKFYEKILLNGIRVTDNENAASG